LRNLTHRVSVMLKKLYRNRKGTAEVIGTVMFIVILLFFFTNVYLWHDAAAKKMNDLQLEKINSIIKVVVISTSPLRLEVSNIGGESATLSRLWVNEKALDSGTPDSDHFFINLESRVVRPGVPIQINDLASRYSGPPSMQLDFKVVTTVGNIGTFTLPAP
jgi:hypothetical protein